MVPQEPRNTCKTLGKENSNNHIDTDGCPTSQRMGAQNQAYVDYKAKKRCKSKQAMLHAKILSFVGSESYYYST